MLYNRSLKKTAVCLHFFTIKINMFDNVVVTFDVTLFVVVKKYFFVMQKLEKLA